MAAVTKIGSEPGWVDRSGCRTGPEERMHQLCWRGSDIGFGVDSVIVPKKEIFS